MVLLLSAEVACSGMSLEPIQKFGLQTCCGEYAYVSHRKEAPHYMLSHLI